MILYDYVGKEPDDKAKEPKELEGKVRAWRDHLQVAQQAQLDEKLDSLANASPEQLPGLMAGPLKVKGRKYPHIYKLQIGGKIRLRPLLCRGPQDGEKEITLLAGATERDGKFDPPNAPEQAVSRREEVRNNERLRQLYKFPQEAAE